MTIQSPERRFTPARIVALLLLLVTGALGVWSASSEFSDAHTILQRIAAATEASYGVLGLAAAFGWYRDQPWAAAATFLWAACLTATGGLAPVAWGGTTIWIGLLGGACTALIAWWVVVKLRR